MLNWLIWDPNRDFLTLPLIDRPIGWYGLLFALGFLCGYYVIVYFVRRFLCAYPKFSIGDISWQNLLLAMRSKEETIEGKVIRDLFFKLDRSCQKAIVRLPKHGMIDEKIKQQMVDSLNQLLEDEEYFKCIEFGAGDQKKSLRKAIEFVKKKVDPKKMVLLERRLLLEGVFSSAFIPLSRRAMIFCERITLYVMVGTVLGARLGHLLFYESFGELISDPFVIFRTWEGGLASHGGVIGILVALGIFVVRIRKQYPMMNWIRLIDFLVVPSICASIFIRLGNFFNQEILGKAATVPWAVVFMHPADGRPPLPRHPAQLYEAGFYLVAFAVLFFLWRKYLFTWRPGKISGLFFISIFSFRFFIEYMKESQSIHLPEDPMLLMGQYLSIPLVLFGALLLGNFRQIPWRKGRKG